jgi:hypothetical protein
MLALTFIPDLAGAADVIICKADRDLAGMNPKLTCRRKLQAEDLIFSEFAIVYDRVGENNKRTMLSVEVRRAMSNTPAAFTSEADAFVWALDHPDDFPGTGTLKIDFGGANIRWLLNCAVEVLEMPDLLGKAPLFRYTFNGGEITKDNPL